MDNINIKTICRTCLSDNVPLNKIQEAVVSVEDSRKSVLEVLNIVGVIEVNDLFHVQSVRKHL
ncbi:uncharacterized protein LOC108914832 isoform X2 [Anoplophora glabripennis]|uniref:uncharacterized protein LOC108914832 isoform X2 n=1 Tax=Anoplophora glabripennis TaxID=217634 RepID=UPI0008739B8F|nr:uncharacterized protein LOC108914832 isoform X2 [Anoplophora glabripennis]